MPKIYGHELHLFFAWIDGIPFCSKLELFTFLGELFPDSVGPKMFDKNLRNRLKVESKHNFTYVRDVTVVKKKYQSLSSCEFIPFASVFKIVSEFFDSDGKSSSGDKARYDRLKIFPLLSSDDNESSFVLCQGIL